MSLVSMALEGIIIEVGGSKVILEATLLSSYHFSLQFVVFGSTLIKKTWPGTVIASFYNAFVTVHWLINFPPHSVVNVTFIGSLLVHILISSQFVIYPVPKSWALLLSISLIKAMPSTLLHYSNWWFFVIWVIFILILSLCHQTEPYKMVNTITKSK